MCVVSNASWIVQGLINVVCTGDTKVSAGRCKSRTRGWWNYHILVKEQIQFEPTGCLLPLVWRQQWTPVVMLSQLAVTHFIGLKIVQHFIRTGLRNGLFPFPLFSQYTCNINRHVNHLMLTCFLINFYFF